MVAPLVIAGAAMAGAGLIGHLLQGKGDAEAYLKQARDAINAVRVPDPEEMKVNLDKLVQQGIITPEIAQVYQMNPTAFDQIQTDPRAMQAELNALQQLEQIAGQGGLTATDKAKISDIQDQLQSQERGAREAILQNAKERGVGGSDVELMAQLQNNQA